MASSSTNGSRRRYSEAAEKALARSVAIEQEHKAAQKVAADAAQRAIKARRREWLKAVSPSDSAVTHRRIAEECGVSIQLVHAELAKARQEMAAK